MGEEEAALRAARAAAGGVALRRRGVSARAAGAAGAPGTAAVARDASGVTKKRVGAEQKEAEEAPVRLPGGLVLRRDVARALLFSAVLLVIFFALHALYWHWVFVPLFHGGDAENSAERAIADLRERLSACPGGGVDCSAELRDDWEDAVRERLLAR